MLHSWQPAILRQNLINHIMKIRLKDEAYARHALHEYNMLLPWMTLNDGVREALKGEK
jgi:hypothetical protein